jgi:hypothetical protein
MQTFVSIQGKSAAEVAPLAALDCRGIGQRNGEDVLHPRLVRGRYLETEPHINTAIFGQPSLFCYEHQC